MITPDRVYDIICCKFISLKKNFSPMSLASCMQFDPLLTFVPMWTSIHMSIRSFSRVLVRVFTKNTGSEHLHQCEKGLRDCWRFHRHSAHRWLLSLLSRGKLPLLSAMPSQMKESLPYCTAWWQRQINVHYCLMFSYCPNQDTNRHDCNSSAVTITQLCIVPPSNVH